MLLHQAHLLKHCPPGRNILNIFAFKPMTHKHLSMTTAYSLSMIQKAQACQALQRKNCPFTNNPGCASQFSSTFSKSCWRHIPFLSVVKSKDFIEQWWGRKKLGRCSQNGMIVTFSFSCTNLFFQYVYFYGYLFTFLYIFKKLFCEI